MTSVARLILDTLPRIGTKPTGTTIYQAISLINSMITKRLLDKRSDLLRVQEMSITLAAGGTTYDLPAGFAALAEHPFMMDAATGYRRHEMDPLDDHRSHYLNRTAMWPRKYELLGTQIAFYPPLDPDSTPPVVTARYYSQPVAIYSAAQVLPFDGMFDNAYLQGVPRAVVKGLSVVQADPDFAAFLNNEVDTVLNARVQPLPERRVKRSQWI